MFKVGDRVKVLDGEIEGGGHCDLKIGEIYKIDGKDYYLKDDKNYEHCSCPLKSCQIKLVTEDTMKERIERLDNGWDKAAQDILDEIGKDFSIQIYETHISSYVNYNTEEFGSGKEGECFYYRNRCEKMRAFKDTLLWLAEKAGKLKPDLSGQTGEVEVDGQRYEAKFIKLLP